MKASLECRKSEVDENICAALLTFFFTGTALLSPTIYPLIYESVQKFHLKYRIQTAPLLEAHAKYYVLKKEASVYTSDFNK